MKALGNQKGIMLVTTLMLTLILLVIVMVLFYLMTAGSKISGAQKRYRTALDASYGGAEIVVKDIIPLVLRSYSSGTTLNSSLGGLTATYSNINLQFPGSNPGAQMCLQYKLKSSTASWPAACLDTAAPAKLPDFTLQLQSSSSTPFTVFSKIVATRAGNSDLSGFSLLGAGVTESDSIAYPQSQPYLYTIEIQGQLQGDASISSDLEVLYAY